MPTFIVFILLLASSVSASDSKVSQDARSPTESYFMWLWHSRLYLYSAAALVFGLWFLLKKKNVSKDASKEKNDKVDKAAKKNDRETKKVHVSGVKIFYGSQTGTAKGFANELSEEVKSLGLPAEVIDMKDYDPDDQLADEDEKRGTSWRDGRKPECLEYHEPFWCVYSASCL
uniref:tRNA-yW synthesizing protein 1 homolog (S. cerevisiae) n=1 Tax=Neolamprologus brichardi TaxID=32507 RepID=A0A3Q4HWX5_NEOBR